MLDRYDEDGIPPILCHVSWTEMYSHSLRIVRFLCWVLVYVSEISVRLDGCN